MVKVCPEALIRNIFVGTELGRVVEILRNPPSPEIVDTL